MKKKSKKTFESNSKSKLYDYESVGQHNINYDIHEHEQYEEHQEHHDLNVDEDYEENQEKKHNIGHTNHKNKNGNNKEHHGKNNHHLTMMQDFKRRLIISLFVTIPILVLSSTIQVWLGINISFSGSDYLLFILSSFIYFYGGWPFLRGLYLEIKTKSLGMMTLIAVAISVAYFYSTAVVFGLSGMVFFWELATLIDIMLLGHWIEMKSVFGASRALEKLAQLLPDKAHLIKGESIVDVQVKMLKKGDKILVKPGERIPADGMIINGSSYINQSFLTGESKPVEKKKDDEVIGGAINGEGALEILVKNIGEESYISKVILLVKKAQESKSKTQNLADRAAFFLTVIALSIGLFTFVAWYLAGETIAFSIERMATVMVITCPHALGLAIPLVVAVSTTISAKNGLIIKNRTAFENARKITTVVFDKTGTLTEGNFGVTSVQTLDPHYDEHTIIQLAASLEKNSEHPIAKGILSKANGLKIKQLIVSNYKNITGQGVQGEINNKSVKLVSITYLINKKIQFPKKFSTKKTETIIYFLVDDHLVGILGLSDIIRKESYKAVNLLRKAGIKCWMLTGDSKEIAQSVSEELQLDGYFAEILPDEKQQKIKELQSKGEFVAMTGDGVNDAPALAQADVGIAIGSGTDIAAETADIILVNNNPTDVTNLILFGRTTYNKMVQNLFWATGYNAIAIPLAAGVLYYEGIIISPAIGAILMSVSTLIVAINSKLLKITKNV